MVAARGAMSTVVPDTLDLTVTYLDSSPVSEVMLFSEGDEGDEVGEVDDLRLVVRASSTALAEHLDDDPSKRDIYTFGHLVQALPEAMPVVLPDGGCAFVELRPFTDGTFFGSVRTYTCADGGAVARVVAVSAARDVAVLAEALGDDLPEARDVATTALRELEVDVGELPTAVASPPVILTE